MPNAEPASGNATANGQICVNDGPIRAHTMRSCTEDEKQRMESSRMGMKPGREKGDNRKMGQVGKGREEMAGAKDICQLDNG